VVDVNALSQDQALEGAVAVVGLACRLPGSPDVASFWEGLLAGRDGIRHFTRHELLEAGHAEESVDRPGFVGAKGWLAHADCFDAGFFGMSPREAQLTDPQHRVFLELCWAVFEDAAIDPARLDVPVGVYGACSANTYLRNVLLADRALYASLGGLQSLVGADADHLATRVAWKLDLRGPAMTVRSACSSSLVAVQLGMQALQTGQCDLALVGGVSISAPLIDGQLHQPGGIYSPDGRCRSYDASAGGSIGGDGAVVLLLRPLEDAVAAADPIRAVLLSSAVNNDGGARIGYTAPGVDGQAEVVELALALAEVDPGSIGLVEGHGTATPLGDPVEVAALARVYANLPPSTCALGSVKSNLGHLNAAAGVAGLAKAILAVEHGQVPPTLHFESPNPELRLDKTPFFVPTRTVGFPRRPRRAAVSSLGAGGTNAHAVVQEPPARDPQPASGCDRVLLLSARSEVSLDRFARSLSETEASLDDLATTLLARPRLEKRAACLAADIAVAREVLADPAHPSWVRGRAPRDRERPVVFFFPAQGFQHLGLALGLYRADRAFRERIDHCAAVFDSALGIDLVAALHQPAERAAAAEALDDQLLAGPALFSTCWALAQRRIDQGVVPSAVLGHSTGAYVAAAVAGVLELDDAARLFAIRARLMATLPRGAVLHVPLGPEETQDLLVDGATLGLVNGPRSCVVTGSPDAVEAVAANLRAAEVPARVVRVSVPAHSPLLQPIVPAFRAEAAKLRPRAPAVPMLSCASGAWLTDEQAEDPHYWVDHLVGQQRLDRALATLASSGSVLVAELGPARSASVLVGLNQPQLPVVAALAEAGTPAHLDPDEAQRFDRRSVAGLWAWGAELPPSLLGADLPGARVHLPTYAFERVRHWVDADLALDAPVAEARRTRAPRPSIDSPFVAPTSASEELLCEIVGELLGVEGVGREDPFVALGGDSLITLRLIEEIRRRTGHELPPAAAFGGLTVASLARHLPDAAPRAEGADADVVSCLVPIRPTGSRPPLFFVHPAAGIVFPYFELARAMGNDQPFYGLQALGLDGVSEPDRTVEGMAARYVRVVQATRPSGPVLLGAYSFGSLVAYEMARQLTDAGRDVAYLALVDEPAPIDGHRTTLAVATRSMMGRAGRSFFHHLHDYLYLRAGKGRRGLPVLLGRGGEGSRVRRALERSAMAALVPQESQLFALGQPAMRPMAELFAVQMLATVRYNPSTWPGALHLFTSELTDEVWIARRDPSPCLGWSKLALGGVEVSDIPGDHLSCLRRPHVERLAALLRTSIDQASPGASA